MKRIKIVYYSGTGCTETVANCLEKTLRERGMETDRELGIEADRELGIETEVFKITAGKSCGLDDTDTLVLLYPVHFFTMPGPVLEWLSGLSEGNGRRAAVISVSGGGEISPNSASRVRAKNILKAKGCDVFYEDSIIMLSNYAVETPEPFATMVLKVLPEKVNTAADGILSGARKKLPTRFFDRFFAWVGRSFRHFAKLWGRGSRVSSECDGCGICAGICSSGNITMTDSKPDFGKNCCMCLGCFYACPKGALSPKVAKTIIVNNYDLKGLEEKALVSERIDVSGVKAGYLWLGVKKYLSS